MKRHVLALVAALGICTTPLHATADPPDDRVELAADQVVTADTEPRVVELAAAPTAIPDGAEPATVADAGPAAEVANVPDLDADAAGWLRWLYERVVNGDWPVVAIGLAVLLTYAIRRWPHVLKYIGLGAASDWIQTAKGGVVLAGLVSFGGWAVHSAAAAGGWPTSDGLGVALGALAGSLAVLLPSRAQDA